MLWSCLGIRARRGNGVLWGIAPWILGSLRARLPVSPGTGQCGTPGAGAALRTQPRRKPWDARGAAGPGRLPETRSRVRAACRGALLGARLWPRGVRCAPHSHLRVPARRAGRRCIYRGRRCQEARRPAAGAGRAGRTGGSWLPPGAPFGAEGAHAWGCRAGVRQPWPLPRP